MSIQVTVGRIPGGAKEVVLDSVKTVAEAIRLAEFSADGYEIRVNNVVITDFNHELSDEDLVSLVKNVKGNAGVSLILVNVTLPDGTKKKAHITKGSYLVAVKSTISLPGKFSDYVWKVDGKDVGEKDFILNNNCSVIIESANVAAKGEDMPAEKAEEKAPIKKPAKKKAEVKSEEKAADTEEKKETMLIYVTYNGGPEYVLELPRKTRITAVLKDIDANKKWNQFVVTKNGTLVKLAFMELKDGDKITVEDSTLVTSDTEEKAPIKKPAKKKAETKPEEKIEKNSEVAEEVKAENAECCDAPTEAQEVESNVSESVSCETSCKPEPEEDECCGHCKDEDCCEDAEFTCKPCACNAAIEFSIQEKKDKIAVALDEILRNIEDGYDVKNIYCTKSNATNFESNHNANILSVCIELEKHTSIK